MQQTLDGVYIGHYRIERLLARGGMSEIYLGKNTETNQSVAVKLVRMNDKEYCERFRREVGAIAAFQHDHILPALDYGEYGSWCYMVTPYIEHGTLHERLCHQGSFSLEDAGNILQQLASALQFAHEQGVVHRDIKPSNVLLRDGSHVYLADFGLVKRAGDKHSLTQSGYIIGTPEYMAPELVEGPATVASDIYALGVLLYQMLTGRVPFQASTPVSIVWKHLQDQPEPPSTINPAIPFEIEQVILRALAKDPKNRFSTAQEMVLAYQQALHDEDKTLPMGTVPPVQIRVVPVSSITALTPNIGKIKPRVLSVVLVALVLLILLGFIIAQMA